MKNGLSLREQQLQVIMYYIITSAFHKHTCRQNKCTPKIRKILQGSINFNGFIKDIRPQNRK